MTVRDQESGRASICVAVNKDEASLSPSESFINAHIDGLPFRTLSVVGNSCLRFTDKGAGPSLLSQHMPARGWRWARRMLGLDSLAAQDTRSLIRYLKKNGCGLLLAEYGPTALSVCRAAERTGIPLVTHFHGWDAYVLAKCADGSPEYRALFDVSEAIIAVSRHMRRHLISLGAAASKVIWNPCGAAVQERWRANPIDAGPTFVSIGRPANKKGTEVTLLAFREVVNREPAARLELVGGGLKERFEYLVRALGLVENVRFNESLSHDAVLQLLADARCYVHPSVTAPDGDREGTPVSILEAMAAGLPVVGTLHGGIPDILGEVSAGALVEEFDVENTAAAMLEYAMEPARAQAHGEAGRQHFETNWTMDISLQRLARIIELAMARDRSGLSELAGRC